MAAGLPTQSRIFNMGSGVGTSLNDLIALIGDVTGLNVPVHYSAGRDFDVPHIRLDISRARQELGWQPLIELKNGIFTMFDSIGKVLMK